MIERTTRPPAVPPASAGGLMLRSPASGTSLDRGSVVFAWDVRDARWRATGFKLRVVEKRVGQSPEEAVRINPAVFERVIEGSLYCAIPTERLGNRTAIYAWQVTALARRGEGVAAESEAVGVSEVRTLRLARDQADVAKWAVAKGRASPAAELPVHAPVAGPCPNGDLETGTLQGWTAYYGSRLNSSTINLNSLQQGSISGRHTIRSLADGYDPVLGGTLLPQVGEGTYSVRLGNSGTSGEADLLAYTFVVTPANQWFSFRYAVVLQNPRDHSEAEQPFFSYYVLRGSSIFFSKYNLPVAGRQVVADSGNPFFKTQGDIVYREWTPTCVDLRGHLGEPMTIVFATADCSQGGHFGYAYIDGLCRRNDAVAAFTMAETVCAGAELWADGSASQNETSCFWSVEESDSAGGRNPPTEVAEWFVAQQAGPIELRSFYASHGGSFQCGRYYRIKLAVSNECTPWNESVHLLHVTCPPVSAGPDRCVHCKPLGGVAPLGQGTVFIPGLTYAWTPAIGLNNPNSPSPLHSEGSVPYPATYTVTVTDEHGCTSSDQVTIYCEVPTCELLLVPRCCGATLIAQAAGYSSIVWSTGQTGVTSIEVNRPGTYTVTAANACGTVTRSVVVPASITLTGFFNPVAANSRFFPPDGDDGYADQLYIKDVIVGGGVQGTPNAYNATEYKLEIFDRWGELFRTIQGESCTGFNNWDIAWDGRDAGGSIVQQGVYNWKLHFKNCQYTEWTTPLERRFADRVCVDWATLFGIKLWCKHYNIPDGTTVDVPLEVGSVTVIG